MVQAEAHSAINNLLYSLQQTGRAPESILRARLHGRIVDTLPDQSLRAMTTNGRWEIVVPPAFRSDRCKTVLADTTYPHVNAMAEFRHQKGNWILASFKTLCPVCFGTGINEPQCCDFCFGVGWSVFEGHYDDNAKATRAIAELLAVRATNDQESDQNIRERLQKRLEEAFPSANLRMIATGTWQMVGTPIVASGVAKCLLTDAAFPKSRVLAELHYSPDGWRLHAFDAECPDCGGVGLLTNGKNYTFICDRCFGMGWGIH